MTERFYTTDEEAQDCLDNDMCPYDGTPLEEWEEGDVIADTSPTIRVFFRCLGNPWHGFPSEPDGAGGHHPIWQGEEA